MANARTIARLEAQILRRAAHCLQFELADPRASFITITRVELAPDVTRGKIFYSLFDSSERKKAERMMKDAAGFIQRQVASVLSLRNMPHLSWVYDESLAEAQHVDEVIRAALKRDAEIAGRSPNVDNAPAAGDSEAESADGED